jgi:RNA polymerase sigma-70 factor (ECF subfamily)
MEKMATMPTMDTLVLSLPEKYREAVLLFYLHGMDLPSAAQSLGLPVGTLKARVSRAREILRSKLSHQLTARHTKEV